MKNLILLSLALCSVSVSAQSSDLPVDYTYSCEKFVKPAGSGSNEFIQIEEQGTDYILKIGKNKSAWPFGINFGGPWFSLEEVNRGDLMVIGVTQCVEEKYSTGWVAVHLDCIDQIGANDEGFGYYHASGSWTSYSQPRTLPGLHNNNLKFSSGFWQGDTEGLITTSTLSGYDYVSEDSVTNTRIECQRVN